MIEKTTLTLGGVASLVSQHWHFLAMRSPCLSQRSSPCLAQDDLHGTAGESTYSTLGPTYTLTHHSSPWSAQHERPIHSEMHQKSSSKWLDQDLGSSVAVALEDDDARMKLCGLPRETPANVANIPIAALTPFGRAAETDARTVVNRK